MTERIDAGDQLLTPEERMVLMEAVWTEQPQSPPRVDSFTRLMKTIDTDQAELLLLLSKLPR